MDDRLNDVLMTVELWAERVSCRHGFWNPCWMSGKAVAYAIDALLSPRIRNVNVA